MTSREWKREYMRAYYAANRDRINAQQRARHAANPERRRSIERAARAKDPERARAQDKAWRDANPDRRRQSKKREYDANKSRYQATRMRWAHGITPEAWAAMWQEQDGRCYLCRRPMTTDEAVVEHDHSCCGPKNSCRACRRGLACADCNPLIGFADDDPDRLRLIADNLEAANRRVADRKSQQPSVLPLWNEEAL